MRRDGLVETGARILKRAWQIYVAHVFVFVMFAATVALLAAHAGSPYLIDKMGLQGFFQEPGFMFMQVLLLRFKPANERRYVGKSVPIFDLDDIVRGKATYGIDVVLPGMKYASVERCSVYGGKAVRFDPTDALKVPGVEQVVEIALGHLHHDHQKAGAAPDLLHL